MNHGKRVRRKTKRVGVLVRVGVCVCCEVLMYGLSTPLEECRQRRCASHGCRRWRVFVHAHWRSLPRLAWRQGSALWQGSRGTGSEHSSVSFSLRSCASSFSHSFSLLLHRFYPPSCGVVTLVALGFCYNLLTTIPHN